MGKDSRNKFHEKVNKFEKKGCLIFLALHKRRQEILFLVFLALHRRRQEILFLEIALGELKSKLFKMKKTIGKEESVLVSGVVVY